MIVVTPFAGVLVDRLNRKVLIGSVDMLQALATVALIILFWSGVASVWFVFGILAFRSVCQAFHSPAVTAIVPLMVPRDKLSRINGLSYLLNGMMTLLGPVVGAVLLAFWTVDWILWVDPITFVMAIIPLLLIKIPSVKMEGEKAEKRSFWKDFGEGLSFVRNKRGLMPVVMLATLLNFLFMPLVTLIPYFVKYDHFGGSAELAIVMAAFQAGMFIGGLLMLALKEFKRKMLVTAVCILLAYAAYALTALTPTGWFWFMAAGAFLLDLCVAPANVSLRTILQVVVPAEMQGRVNAVLTSLASAASPFGMILAGTIVGFTGTVSLFLGCAATGTLVLLAFWFFTDMRKVEETEEATTADKAALT
jgi:DHA3 family macrolide efflux protein-like MFS transporter